MKLGEQVGVGRTASVYKWGKNEVIKVFHDEQEAMHEHHNAAWIDRLALPSPKCSGMVTYEGKLCIIYQYIAGVTMLRRIEPDVTSITEHARLMAELHCQLHSHQVQAPSHLMTFMTNKISQLEQLTEPEKQRVLIELATLSDGQELCHYDFHPDNIMITGQTPIIIDWMNVCIGPRLADVARTVMMLDSHELPPNPPRWVVNRALRSLFTEQYRFMYGMLTGTNQAEIDQWEAPTLAVRVGEMHNEEQQEALDRLRKHLN